MKKAWWSNYRRLTNSRRNHGLGGETVPTFSKSPLSPKCVIVKASISVGTSVGEHFPAFPFVLADTWVTASFLLSSTSASLPSPLPPCPEGVNCRVGRALVQAPGWQGPPTLSFTQDRLIHVLWALWRLVCQDSWWLIELYARSCIRASVYAPVNGLWWWWWWRAAGCDEIRGCIEVNYVCYLSMLAKIAIIWVSKRC